VRRVFYKLGLVAIVLLLCTACLSIQRMGEPHGKNFPVADPTVATESTTSGQLTRVFGTNDRFTPWNVPSFGLAAGTASDPHDAMPTVPGWSNGVHIWAPEIVRVGSGWLLLFGASRNSGRLCIGAARSGALDAEFVPTSFRMCSEDMGWGGNFGLLDPDLYEGPGGPLLVFSRQTGRNGRGQSAIVAVPFDPGTLARTGPPRVLITFDQAEQAAGVGAAQVAGRPGSPAVIENPHLMVDPYNQGGLPLLLFSMGSWTDQGDGYVTVEVPCTLERCFPTLGGIIIRGVGGVSSAGNTTADPGVMVGHQWRDGHRWPMLLSGQGFTRGFG
jgi:hypothetical protein